MTMGVPVLVSMSRQRCAASTSVIEGVALNVQKEWSVPENHPINDNVGNAPGDESTKGADSPKSGDHGLPAKSRPGTSDPSAKKQGRPLSEENKQALVLGRQRSRWVDEYIKALEVYKWQNRGTQKPDPDEIKRQIAKLDEELPGTEGVKKVLALRERADLVAKLEAAEGADEFASLEARFISVVRQFSAERRVPYDVWRQIGVPFRTLAKAGMYPSRAKRGGVTGDSPEELEDWPEDQN